MVVIVFDLGNVLFSNDWHYHKKDRFEAFSKAFGMSYEGMEAAWDVVWPKYKRGHITEEEFWEAFFEKGGAKTRDIKKAKTLYREYQEEIPGMHELVADLYGRYRLAVLSNISREWADYKLDRYDVRKYFDVIVTSADAGCAKPEIEIYQLLLHRLCVQAVECVLIDNTESKLAPARELGFSTILFQNAEQARAALKPYLT
jgi:putative hydrolase of the HAD superfamily